MHTAFGLLLAFASALGLTWGLFTQHRAASGLPRVSPRRPVAALRTLFTDRRWVLGYGVGIGGWALYIAALAFAPISLVQAVAAGGIGLLALFAWGVTREQVVARDRVAVALCMAGLALLVISFAGGVPKPRSPGATAVLVWVVAVGGMGALLWIVGSRVLRPGASLGAAAGLFYAAGDISTKGALSVAVLFAVLLVLCHVLGFVALQLAFQRGTALVTAGLATLLNNGVPIVAGVLVFSERLPPGVFGAVRALSFVLVVSGAALLAGPMAVRNEQPPTGRAAGQSGATPVAGS